MDCSLPGSSVHGIFQARVLEWVAIAFSFHKDCFTPLLSLLTSCLDFSMYPDLLTHTHTHTHTYIGTIRRNSPQYSATKSRSLFEFMLIVVSFPPKMNFSLAHCLLLSRGSYFIIYLLSSLALSSVVFKNTPTREFPGGPVVRTLCSHY